MQGQREKQAGGEDTQANLRLTDSLHSPSPGSKERAHGQSSVNEILTLELHNPYDNGEGPGQGQVMLAWAKPAPAKKVGAGRKKPRGGGGGTGPHPDKVQWPTR